MILEFPRTYPADEAERRLPDLATAHALLDERAAPLEALLARRRVQWRALTPDAEALALLARTEDAVRLAYARLALRHGSLGTDFHAYHNEGHILEICAGRIDRLCDTLGADGLSLRDGCALMLFGAGHDLRQREAPQLVGGVGANERASIEETQRILDACGFSRERDADLYTATELMIAGSTFDARPLPGGHLYNAADLVQNGGALAARLDQTLDARRPDWRADADLLHARQLALVAADLDTANVAEPFRKFATTAENLCREREMLSGRSLSAGESALPVLGFLTDGQDRFFFELHRFQSEPGRAAFESGKQANASKLKALCMGLRARIAVHGRPESGDQVIAAYRETLADLVD
ncbi:hypothetical protein [Dokdonella soli]|uniref:Uncharacterized protein n=1 Tax=Dokdonella soli TaxID=529810 RepID=A0ABN1IEE3_9GAMM